MGSCVHGATPCMCTVFTTSQQITTTLVYSVPEECPQAVADLYERCIESDPAMRPTAKEVARTLITIIKEVCSGVFICFFCVLV